jgi:hypothetical protein
MMKSRAGAAVGLLAGLMLVGSGCYGYYGPAYGPAYGPTYAQPAVVVGPGVTPTPGPMMGGPPMPGMGAPRQIVGVGASLGFFSATDVWTYGGVSANVHANLYLTPIFGVQADLGVASVAEDWYAYTYGAPEGVFTVVPIYVSAFVSIPDIRTPMIRYKFALGTGFAAVSFDLDSIASDPLGIFVVQAGSEFLFQGGRMFAMVDMMGGGDVVTGAGWPYDFNFMAGVRFGAEIGF